MDKKKKYIIVGVGILLVSIGIGIVIKRLLNKAPDDTLPIKKNVESTEEETNTKSDTTTTETPKIPTSVDTKIGTRLRMYPRTEQGTIKKTYNKVVNLQVSDSVKKDDGVWYFVKDSKYESSCLIKENQVYITNIDDVTGNIEVFWESFGDYEVYHKDDEFYPTSSNFHYGFKDPITSYPLKVGDTLYYIGAFPTCVNYSGWVREDVVTPKY